jgi:site-specific DNA recombinase
MPDTKRTLRTRSIGREIETPRKGIICARVSSNPQKEGFSLPAQIKYLKEHAARLGVEIVRVFSFVETAKKQGRKHFNEVLEFLKSNRDITVAFFEKTDRLSRNLQDFVRVEELVESLDIEIHLVKEGQVLRKAARSQDRLIQGIFALLARNYIQNMLEEIIKGQTIKAEKGQYPGRAPFGYKHDREHRTIVDHPGRAPVIRLIFELFSSGSYSLKALRDAIIDKTGERISKSYLHHILTSRFYIGFFRWRGQEYEGKHPHLIDVATFKVVQRIVSGKSKRKPRHHQFAFTEIMQCSHDGCAITAEMQKQIHIYYHCSFGRGRHSFPYLKEESVAELLGSVLISLRLPVGIASAVEAQTDEAAATKAAQRRQEIGRLNQRINAVTTRMANALQRSADHPEAVDEDVFQRCMAQWKAEKKQAESDLQTALQSSSKDPELSADRIADLAVRAHAIYHRLHNGDRARLLKMVMANCRTDGRSIHPEFRSPFGVLFSSLELCQVPSTMTTA